MYDRELLAIVETMKQWRHYLEGAYHRILIHCHCNNLEYFHTSKVLSWRQARWAETVSSYDFIIRHLAGNRNLADGPSRRPDYEIEYDRPTAQLLATITAVEPYDDLLPIIKTAQATDILATDANKEIVDIPMAGYPDLTVNGRAQGAKDSHRNWKVTSGALTYKGWIYIPEPLRSKVISLFPDNSKSGHFAALRTTELVSRDCYSTAMGATVWKYVAGCEVCHGIKVPHNSRHGTSMPLPPPHPLWEGVTIDFITDLPKSMVLAYTGILVIVDRLTKIAIYLPCRKDIDSPELAQMFFEYVICKHVVPDNIITDRGTQFTRQFWNRVCSHMSINHCLWTAFHPHTDGQTECQNQTMEEYLQAFCNYKQDNWVELLPLVEFAYNNSVHASTMMTPLWAVYHRHLEMQFQTLKASSLKSETEVDILLEGLEETHRVHQQNLFETQKQRTKYAGGKEITFEVGYRV